MEFPMFVTVQIPIKWKYSVESHIISRLWVFEEIRSYYETQIIHRVWNVKFHTMGILRGKLIHSHTMSFQ